MENLELKKKLYTLWSRIYQKYEGDLFHDTRSAADNILEEFINEFHEEYGKIKILQPSKNWTMFRFGDYLVGVESDGEISFDDEDIVFSFYPAEGGKENLDDLTIISDHVYYSPDDFMKKYSLDLPKFSEWTEETLLMIKMVA